MYTHSHEVRVRYGETDQMGYLYYGNYALYYEVGRVELLRSLGLTYREMEDEWRIAMPVTSMSTRYVRPARYDDVLEIATSLRELPDRTVTFHCELHNQHGELVNGGRVTLCFLDRSTQRRVSCPPRLLEALSPHFA